MILTERLELVPASVPLVRAALAGPAALTAGLDAHVPPTWPPEYLDAAALDFTLARLAEGPQHDGWWLHFVVLRAATGGRTLIGSAGYCGPPTAEGVVEIGYGIVSDRRRQGYASETVRGLLAHAFALPSVRRVIAHTLPALAPSIGVLLKCGFQPVGEGAEPGVIRYELQLADFAVTVH
jgi:RimJ/RimL family protein N-acetyltransferase